MKCQKHDLNIIHDNSNLEIRNGFIDCAFFTGCMNYLQVYKDCFIYYATLRTGWTKFDALLYFTLVRFIRKVDFQNS